MKVKDAIKKLKSFNPEAELIITSSNFELNGSKVPVSFMTQYNEGSIRKQMFKDGFDGGIYQTETWSIIGGKLPVVTIS